MSTLWSGDSPTVTWLGRVSPAATFRFEVCGTGAPCGQTVMAVDADTLVAVRLNTTAVAAAGT